MVSFFSIPYIEETCILCTIWNIIFLLVTTEWKFSTLGYSSCYRSYGRSSDCQGILSSKLVRRLVIHWVRLFSNISLCEMKSGVADSPSLWNCYQLRYLFIFVRNLVNSVSISRLYAAFNWCFFTSSVVFWILTELYWRSFKFWLGCWGSKIWGIQSWGMWSQVELLSLIFIENTNN